MVVGASYFRVAQACYLWLNGFRSFQYVRTFLLDHHQDLSRDRPYQMGLRVTPLIALDLRRVRHDETLTVVLEHLHRDSRCLGNPLARPASGLA